MGFFEKVGQTAEQHKTKSSETFKNLKDKIKGVTSKISGFMKNMPFYASAFAAEGAKATGATIEQGSEAVAAKVETTGEAVDKKVEAAVKIARNAIEGAATKAHGSAINIIARWSEWRKNVAQEKVDKFGSRLETMQRALESIQEKQNQLQKQKEALLNALGTLEGRTEAPAMAGAM